MAERVRCENCPARNRWVREFTVFGKRVMLCRECRKVAERVAVTMAKRPIENRPQAASLPHKAA